MAVPQADLAEVVAQFQLAIAKLSAKAAAAGLAWFVRAQRRRGRDLVPVAVPHMDEGVRLGVAFYRLYRGLATGATTPDPLRPRLREKQVSVGVLVREFEAASGSRLRLRTSPRLRVPVEPVNVFDGLVEQARRKEAQRLVKIWDDRVEQAARRGGLGDSDGVYASGVAQQAAANGARQVAAQMGRRDRRLKGWVRVSSTGSPCAYCAMLMSRGAAYKSKDTAWGGGGAEDRFHPHCKCVARPVFHGESYPEGTFALNQQFWSDWKKLSATLGRAPRVSDWRSFYYRQYQKNPG